MNFLQACNFWPWGTRATNADCCTYSLSLFAERTHIWRCRVSTPTARLQPPPPAQLFNPNQKPPSWQTMEPCSPLQCFALTGMRWFCPFHRRHSSLCKPCKMVLLLLNCLSSPPYRGWHSLPVAVRDLWQTQNSSPRAHSLCCLLSSHSLSQFPVSPFLASSQGPALPSSSLPRTHWHHVWLRQGCSSHNQELGLPQGGRGGNKALDMESTPAMGPRAGCNHSKAGHHVPCLARNCLHSKLHHDHLPEFGKRVTDWQSSHELVCEDGKRQLPSNNGIPPSPLCSWLPRTPCTLSVLLV